MLNSVYTGTTKQQTLAEEIENNLIAIQPGT